MNNPNPILAGLRLLAADFSAALPYEVRITEETRMDVRYDTGREELIYLEVPELNLKMGTSPYPDATANGVAQSLASDLQDDVMSATGMIWPAHPGHGDQPLLPGDAGWYSSMDPTVLVPYGEVRHAHKSDPELHGVVRWWLQYWYVGLIADRSGDVWFSDHEFEGDLYAIRPGMPVEYTIGDRMHRNCRKAVAVRPRVGSSS